MKQPLFKRRRVSSSSHAPLPSSDTIFTSPMPSRVSTCTSCHRAVGLKSNPAFLCARCNASTCAICLRSCTGDPVSSPRWASSPNLGWDPTAISLSQNKCNTNNSYTHRRHPRDEDSDNKSKNVDNERSTGSSCGQTVCRMCCFEHPQSGAISCLDCSANQLATQTHEPNTAKKKKEMQAARNSDHSLIASS